MYDLGSGISILPIMQENVHGWGPSVNRYLIYSRDSALLMDYRI